MGDMSGDVPVLGRLAGRSFREGIAVRGFGVVRLGIAKSNFRERTSWPPPYIVSKWDALRLLPRSSRAAPTVQSVACQKCIP